MNSNPTYTLLTTITIGHEYYDDLYIPIELIPEEQTISNFRKYDIRCKRVGNQWFLYGNPQLVAYHADMEAYHFFIQSSEAEFFYVTDLAGSEVVNCTSTTEKKMVFRIAVPITSQQVQIRLKAISKYFEYILILKNQQAKQWCIRSREGIAFEDMNRIIWGDKMEAIQFKSKEKVRLKRVNTYYFKLVELSEFGERTLLQHLGSPSPQSLSLKEPYHTITAYHSL